MGQQLGLRRTLIQRLKWVLVAAGICLSSQGWAGVNISPLLSELPSGSQVSFVLLDPKQNKVLANHQGELLLKPASLQKILTATAALLQLGPDFHYTTSLKSYHLPRNGRIEGDLLLTFSGDPTLRLSDLDQLFQRLKSQGIEQITGDLKLYNGIFSRYRWGAGWSWDIRGICYAAPISSIMIDGNCFHAKLETRAEGRKAKLYPLSSHSPVTLVSDVMTTPPRLPVVAKNCPLEVDLLPFNHYLLSGCIKPGSPPITLAFAVSDPDRYAIDYVKELLNKYHIRLKGSVELSKRLPKGLHTLAEHQSKPLSLLVKKMLKDSDNQLADSLLKTVGHSYYHTQGTFDNGAQAVRELLLRDANIDLKNSVLKDGSGLSSDDLVSADTFVRLLSWIDQSAEYRDLIQSALPIAGIDGTMQYRFGGKGKPLKGKVIAKTGTLNGVRNLAGFIETRSGRKLIFALLINGYSPDPDPLKGERVSNRPAENFEVKLLESVRRL